MNGNKRKGNKSGSIESRIRRLELLEKTVSSGNRRRKAKKQHKNGNQKRNVHTKNTSGICKLCGVRNSNNDKSTRTTRPRESGKGLESVKKTWRKRANDAIHKARSSYVFKRIPAEKVKAGISQIKGWFIRDYIGRFEPPKMHINTMEPLPEATKTMYVCLKDLHTGDSPVFVIPNFGVRFNNEGQSGRLILKTNKIKEMVPDIDGKMFDPMVVGKRYDVGVLCTNDPTPWTPFDTVSLGYFMFRYIFRDCVCVSKNPPVFDGWTRLWMPNRLCCLRDVVE